MPATPSLVLCLILASPSTVACGGSSSAEPGSAVAAAAPASATSAVPSAPASPAAQGQDARTSAAPKAAPAQATASQPKRPEPSRARADALSVAELVGRRDLWPARVAFLKEARLDATTWHPGEELALHDFDGTNVVLDEGTFLFEWPAEGTDVVKRVRDVAAGLSEEALALTVTSLRERPELWPVRVQTTSSLQFADNKIVPAGREVSVRFFEGDQLSVYDRELANYYQVAPNETDLMARARARLDLPAAEREPFFLRSLAAALEAPDTAVTKRLAEADYVLVYAGRLGCTRCADFLPRFKDFYARMRAAAPAAKFEVVFLPEDANGESARKYVAESEPPGGVLAFERRLEAANLMALPLQLLPGLMVFDRNGQLVERNHPNGGSPSADDVLASFEARLKQPPR